VTELMNKLFQTCIAPVLYCSMPFLTSANQTTDFKHNLNMNICKYVCNWMQTYGMLTDRNDLDCLHGMTLSCLPISMKASTARSTFCRLWAADSWTRIRALPSANQSNNRSTNQSI